MKSTPVRKIFKFILFHPMEKRLHICTFLDDEFSVILQVSGIFIEVLVGPKLLRYEEYVLNFSLYLLH